MKRKPTRSLTTATPPPAAGKRARSPGGARPGAAVRPVPRFALAPQRVRLIGGAWKRTPLQVGNVAGLRPTPDRVRQTVFNWLAHLRPDVAGLRGVDLYAGTGALGLELASRGAARVLLVERDAALVAALRAVVEKLRAATVDVLAGDALAVAAQLPAGAFDVVFLDPPFDAGHTGPALRAADRLLSAGGIIYLEAAKPLEAAEAGLLDLEIVRAARAGQVHFHLLTRATC
jgi:16S rRNA (guanine(966)-N(2))-methyltransferase RsmD